MKGVKGYLGVWGGRVGGGGEIIFLYVSGRYISTFLCWEGDSLGERRDYREEGRDGMWDLDV